MKVYDLCESDIGDVDDVL